MSSYGHSLVPKRGVPVQKITNIGFFAPKPYLKGVDQDFLFDSKFCLVEIETIETLKTAWRLEERIFHNNEKRENH
jgi:hypothetical protein